VELACAEAHGLATTALGDKIRWVRATQCKLICSHSSAWASDIMNLCGPGAVVYTELVSLEDSGRA
jgi:hypothetical protein